MSILNSICKYMYSIINMFLYITIFCFNLEGFIFFVHLFRKGWVELLTELKKKKKKWVYFYTLNICEAYYRY